ncbi:hypothetical protein BaRGS_00009008 [Batillaria attramentaria]|uniref:Uncharacterized protein n=1 Tax=Batillaria attramentaria TaxID=370345 RepID=A0ABD0LJG8_9CAEN
MTQVCERWCSSPKKQNETQKTSQTSLESRDTDIMWAWEIKVEYTCMSMITPTSRRTQRRKIHHIAVTMNTAKHKTSPVASTVIPHRENPSDAATTPANKSTDADPLGK